MRDGQSLKNSVPLKIQECEKTAAPEALRLQIILFSNVLGMVGLLGNAKRSIGADFSLCWKSREPVG